MKIVNRSALTIIPRQPYVDWANTLDDVPKLDITSPHYEYDVYLVDEIADGDDLDWVLHAYYPQIFYEALMGWHTDPRDWPDIFEFETFQQWFEVRVSSGVFDLCGGKLRAKKWED